VIFNVEIEIFHFQRKIKSKMILYRTYNFLEISYFVIHLSFYPLSCTFSSLDDFGRGIGHVLAHGVAGEVYNVGGPDECPNIEVVRRIIELTGADPGLLTYVKDRPGHDRRYSLGSEKVRALGWEAQVRFEEGLERTVRWYEDNRAWWEPIRSGDYREYYARQYGARIGE
jgi:dTDP-glucose 4,6-dehydratase